MKIRFLILPMLAGVIAAGCGSDTTEPTNVACTVTFSSGLSSTQDCTTQIAATYTTATDSSIVSGGRSSDPTLSVSIRVKGIPVTGTFKSSDPGARGFVSASSGSSGWLATTTGMPGNPTVQGTWTMTLTSVTEATITATGKTYTLHGTIDATMPTSNGGVTGVIAHITF